MTPRSLPPSVTNSVSSQMPRSLLPSEACPLVSPPCLLGFSCLQARHAVLQFLVHDLPFGYCAHCTLTQSLCEFPACLPYVSLLLSLVHSVLFSLQVRRVGTCMKIRTCTSLFGRRIDIPPPLGLDSSLSRIILMDPCLARTSPR